MCDGLLTIIVPHSVEQAGRNQGKNVRMMLPMDLVFYMLHAPSGDRVPEYRMLLRLLRNMVSDVDEGGAQRGQKGQRARPAHPCGLPCLYLAFPSIALDMLIMQVQSGRQVSFPPLLALFPALHMHRVLTLPRTAQD